MTTHELILRNQYRMQWMDKNIGDNYHIMLGNLVLDGYDIQNIIDGLWVLFDGKDND